MVSAGVLLKKLASDFEEEVKTLRSGEISPQVSEPKKSKIDVVEAEPFDHPSEKWTKECINNLILAKESIEKTFSKVQDFDPEVELLFYNIIRHINLAESAYNESLSI